MKNEASQEMIMQQLQVMQPMILGGSLISHIIYGIVFDGIAFAIVKNPKKEMTENLSLED